MVVVPHQRNRHHPSFSHSKDVLVDQRDGDKHFPTGAQTCRVFAQAFVRGTQFSTPGILRGKNLRKLNPYQDIHHRPCINPIVSVPRMYYLFLMIDQTHHLIFRCLFGKIIRTTEAYPYRGKVNKRGKLGDVFCFEHPVQTIANRQVNDSKVSDRLPRAILKLGGHVLQTLH